jgi:hypothetical protein
MLPAIFPLAVYRGDTLRFTVRVWQDAAKTLPVDLLGANAAAEIRDAPGGPVVVPLSCAITLPNSIVVTLLASQSPRVPTTGAWDLQLSLLGGDIKTVLAGPVTATSDVTDSAPAGGCTPVSTTSVSAAPTKARARI